MTTEVTASATAEDTTSRDAWEGFVRGPWAEDIDVRDFKRYMLRVDLWRILHRIYKKKGDKSSGS